jgi:Ca2+-binding RTX toxin-like protein
MPDDFADDITTTGTVTVGGSVTGRIETGTTIDRDWFAVEFEAGELYVIRIDDAHPGGSVLEDPFLRGIHDAAGTLLPRTMDDDSGPNLDAFLWFEATVTGRHYISVGAYNQPLPTNLGNGYTLSVEQAITLDGGPGDDWLAWQTGTVQVNGGGGRDTVSMVDAVTGVFVHLSAEGFIGRVSVGGADTFLRSVENAVGTRYDDNLYGTSAANVLRGRAGADLLDGNGGADTLDGGDGRDTAVVGRFFNGGGPGEVASLLRGRVWEGDSAGTRLTGIENLSSGGGDDLLTGDHLRNIFYGNYGDDTLIGNGGDDHLDGYWGTDTVVFSFNQSEYTITREGIRTIVDHTGGSGADGTDVLGHIEILRFADGDLIL